MSDTSGLDARELDYLKFVLSESMSLAKIIAARPSFDPTAANIGTLVHSCFTAVVASTKTKPEAEEPEHTKATASQIRQSVREDFIVCLEDGKKFKSLKRHLRTHYGLSPEEYREKWGLPSDYPMVAPSYSATRSKLAKDNGLGKKVG